MVQDLTHFQSDSIILVTFRYWNILLGTYKYKTLISYLFSKHLSILPTQTLSRIKIELGNCIGMVILNCWESHHLPCCHGLPNYKSNYSLQRILFCWSLPYRSCVYRYVMDLEWQNNLQPTLSNPYGVVFEVWIVKWNSTKTENLPFWLRYATIVVLFNQISYIKIQGIKKLLYLIFMNGHEPKFLKFLLSFGLREIPPSMIQN